MWWEAVWEHGKKITTYSLETGTSELDSSQDKALLSSFSTEFLYLNQLFLHIKSWKKNLTQVYGIKITINTLILFSWYSYLELQTMVSRSLKAELIRYTQSWFKAQTFCYKGGSSTQVSYLVETLCSYLCSHVWELRFVCCLQCTLLLDLQEACVSRQFLGCSLRNSQEACSGETAQNLGQDSSLGAMAQKKETTKLQFLWGRWRFHRSTGPHTVQEVFLLREKGAVWGASRNAVAACLMVKGLFLWYTRGSWWSRMSSGCQNEWKWPQPLMQSFITDTSKWWSDWKPESNTN